MSSYDELRYNNLPNPQTHPSRLFVLARLAGLNPAPVEACKVLELGTSEGANLIGMAVALPRAEFTGIDLAREPVAKGMRSIEALGLRNVRLRCMNLLEVNEAFGKFDYILTHGIYGWTPPAVGEKVLDIARQCLATDGLAFVSYNTYPAGHIRKLVREMILYHAGGYSDPKERLEHARAFLSVLALGRPQPETFDAAAAEYARTLLEHSDSALFHDDLAPVYEPVYFHEFAARAAAKRLKYAGDAGGFDTPRNLRPEAIEGADKMSGGDGIARDQYLDFLRMRGFRRSLLCLKERELALEWEPGRITGCYATTTAHEAEDGSFSSADNVRMSTTHPAPIEYLRKLMAERPRALEVTAEAARLALELFKVGILELHGAPGTAASAGDRPRVSPLVRYQATQGESTVTTLWHRGLEIEGEEARRMLMLLDGASGREALCEAMACSRERLDAELEMLGRLGMLVA